MRTSVLLLACVFTGCAPRVAKPNPDQTIAERIPRECAAESTCSALESDALLRVNSCITTKDRCEAARANLEKVRDELKRIRKAADDARYAQIQAGHEERARQREAEKALESERQKSAHEERQAEEARMMRDIRMRQWRDMGPESREKAIRTCLKNRGATHCKDDVAFAVEAGATKAEKESLQRLADEAAKLE